jgi:hypothetical protein
MNACRWPLAPIGAMIGLVALRMLTPGRRPVVTRYNVGWTLLPVQHPPNRILETRADWQLMFFNRQAIVFSRIS